MYDSYKFVGKNFKRAGVHSFAHSKMISTIAM